MRILTALGVLQLAGFAGVFFMLGSVEASLRSSAPALVEDAPAVTATASTGGAADLDEERLRALIREELSGVLADLAASQDPRESEIAETAPGRNRTVEVDQEHRLESVQDELDQYSRQGSMSEREMIDLQMAIASLDEAGRKQMLRELTRMLNSGEIQGHL